MAKRVGKHLRGNVVAYVALFFALGMGTAWALERNSVRSKHIVDGQVQVRDTRAGHFAPGPRECPAGTRLIAGGCIETTIRPDQNYHNALGACQNEWRRLPSVTELLSARLFAWTLGNETVGHELTSEADLAGTSGTYAQVVGNDGGIGWVVASTPTPFRCVAVP